MKITDTQTTALTAAAARPDGAILPLPAQIRGGAVGKVCDALVAKSLVINVGLPGKQTLVISDDGRRALGLEITPIASAETKPTQRRAGTKQAQLVAMLAAPEGASTAEIVAAFGWQPHTVRGAIAGALRKRLGLQRSGRRRSRPRTRLPHHAVITRVEVNCLESKSQRFRREVQEDAFF